MTLIIGGAGQGKLDYVLGKTGYGPDQVARTPEEAGTRPVFAAWKTGRSWTKTNCSPPTRGSS